MFDAPSNAAGRDGEQPAASASAPGGPGPAVGQAATRLGAPGLQVAITGVVGAAIIGAIAVVVALSGTGAQIVEGPDRALPRTGDTTMLAGAGAGIGEVVVDVTGAVAHPGVYRLPAGSRVADAIDAAGGFGPRVDADRVAAVLNLAAMLTDGSQVHVPSRGESSATPAADSGAGAAGGGMTNLNSASQSELEALPGIGPVTAAKIIESRTAAPFTAIAELRERKLVGEKTFAQLQSLVTVR